jgi:hypothetical protein
VNPIEIEVTAEYGSQGRLGFCHIHSMPMGGVNDQVTVWQGRRGDSSPEKRRVSCESGQVPMLSAF